MAIELPRFDTRDIVGVIGAGTMGMGIAEVAASAGHHVRVFDAVEGAAVHALDELATRLDSRVKRGRITSERRDEILGRIQVVHKLVGLAKSRLVLEAVVESLGIKVGLFKSLERIVAKTTIIGTNTSSFSITEIGADLKHPERFLGVHFFNPASVMPLVEVITGMNTAPEVAAAVHGLMSTWGKSPVFAKSQPGFIVNRVARPYYAEALTLLQEGAASVSTMDAIYRDCGGFRMGPFELMDLIGMDVNLTVTQSVFESYYGDPRYRPSVLQEEMVAARRLGRKTGEGFYRYTPEPEVSDPVDMRPAKAPSSVRVFGNLGPAETLVEQSVEAGLEVTHAEGEGYLLVDGVYLALSDGRSAVTRAVEEGRSPMVLFDLALDYRKTPRIVIAATNGDNQSLNVAAGFFQSLGKVVNVVLDVPGMLVMRSVCLLVNEAASAIAHHVCSAGDLDIAMKKGVNYPKGPVEWGESLDLHRVMTVVAHMHEAYGDDRYRVTPLLARRALAHRKLSD
jgi:3-hydroxybutyryl-CoA dehydrogenase